MAVREKDIPSPEQHAPSETPERPIMLTPSELRAPAAEQVAERRRLGQRRPRWLAAGRLPCRRRRPSTAIVETAGRQQTREVKDKDGKVVRTQAVLRTAARTVLLVAETSPGGIRKALKAAKLRADQHGPDVYHPRYRCWFRCGAKREVDLPENLGELGNGGAVRSSTSCRTPAASVLLSDIEDVPETENDRGE